MPEDQKYEMEETRPVEMPAEHDHTSKQNEVPAYVYELEVQNVK